MRTNGCDICQDQTATCVPSPSGSDAFVVTCPICGTYEMAGRVSSSLLNKHERQYLLSGIIRNRFELGEKIFLSPDALEHLADSVPKFDDPYTKLDLLLKHVYRLSQRVDRWATFDFPHDFSLIYCEDQQEFLFYIKTAKEMGLLESPTSVGLRLTYLGWNRLKELSKISIKSKQAFVAMWFDASLDSAWSDGLKPALESCGFHPMRIDLEEHNEKICDRIISEIRRSGLVIADFTGQRGGVYFESGFAMGLGIPVVRSCHKNDINTLHFDTRQYNHVTWETPADLKEKLANRIRATIPRIDIDSQ